VVQSFLLVVEDELVGVQERPEDVFQVLLERLAVGGLDLREQLLQLRLDGLRPRQRT
jgi:hypothetical protein